MANKKDLLKSNISPVNFFISETAPETNPEATAEGKETKSARINLLFKKSILEDITKIAYIEKTSRNELISQLVEQYINSDKGQEELNQYNNTFKD